MKIEKQIRNKYTNAMISKLQKKNQKYYVLDSEVIGLRIYVQLSGEKSFYLQRYIKEFKYSKKTKIGDFPEMSITAARKLAALIKADNVQGKDPIVAAAERAEEKTLDDVLQEYLIKKHDPRSKNKHKQKAEKSSIDAWLLGKTNDANILSIWKKNRDDVNIKSQQLSKINSETVLDYHSAITLKSSFVANRMVGVVRKLFNYAKAKGYFSGENPASKLRKKLNEEISDHLDYYSTDKMNKIIAATLKKSKVHSKRVACFAILASLFCGGRPQSEVMNLTTDMIDLKNKCIHYKKSKVGQWTRPITPRMMQHLELIIKHRSNGDPVLYYPKDDLRHKYLFPNSSYGLLRSSKRGLKPCKLLHLKDVRKLYAEIKKDAGVEDRDLKALRHTFAVFCVSQGISLRVIQKYLGHKSIKTTEIYATATDEFVEAESNKVTAGYAA
jgi:integrase|tara:strand:- start:319 stop:1641 length:1323 start_codon:yes stop_codon:yes gene_type:complete